MSKERHSSVAFKRFRAKTHQLSRMMWTQELSSHALIESMKSRGEDEIPANFLAAGFSSRMFPENVSQVRSWIPEFRNRIQIHYLVFYTAFIEQYLKDIVNAYMWTRYPLNESEVDVPIKLAVIGRQLSDPILRSSTVPDMLDYAQELFEVDLWPSLSDWKKFYQIRCAGAHLWGIETPEFLKKIGESAPLGDPTGLNYVRFDWPKLRKSLKLADDMVKKIDQKVVSKKLVLAEAEIALRHLYTQKSLPPHNELPKFLHDKYGLFGISREKLKDFIKRFYVRSIDQSGKSALVPRCNCKPQSGK